MGKKRTGLQSNIASIFSGVPIPKKGQPGSGPPSPGTKPEGTEQPKPASPQPRVAPASPVAPASRPAVQPIPEIAPARVFPAAAPERKITQVPSKIPRVKRTGVSGPGVSPTRQKVSVALIVILSVALYFLLAKPFGAPGSSEVGPSVAGPVKANIPPKANVRIDWPVPDVYPVDLHDPMVAGGQEQGVPETPNALVVTAITYSEDVRLAVVGTEMVREGDIVPGTAIKVKKIEPDGVEFEDETGKTWIQQVQSQKN